MRPLAYIPVDDARNKSQDEEEAPQSVFFPRSSIGIGPFPFVLGGRRAPLSIEAKHAQFLERHAFRGVRMKQSRGPEHDRIFIKEFEACNKLEDPQARDICM